MNEIRKIILYQLNKRNKNLLTKLINKNKNKKIQSFNNYHLLKLIRTNIKKLLTALALNKIYKKSSKIYLKEESPPLRNKYLTI